MQKVTIDFETQSEVNLKKAGAAEYAAHVSTRAMCLGVKLDTWKAPWLFDFPTMQMNFKRLPYSFRATWVKWIANPEFVFSGHNAFFEQCIYHFVLQRRLGWPAIPVRKWRCTAAKAAAVAIPRNLADAGAVMRTTTQKDFEGHRVMMKLCKPTKAWANWVKKPVGEEPFKFYTPETASEDFQTLYHYCKIDVVSEELLDAALPDLTPTEQKIWEADQRMNMRGIAVDLPLVNKISNIMDDEARTMNKELDVLTMGLVASGGARDAILDFLLLEGVELPDLRAKTVDDFLANGKMSGDAAALLKIRRALSKSSTAKYAMFKLRAASDGRVRDLLMYHAASTGRWGGKGIQPQNFPRGVIKDTEEAIARIMSESVDDLKMLYGENLMPLFSSVLRGMFIPTPNFNMYVEDYNAIEARVLHWLAGYEDGLEMFRQGIDPYKALAATMFKKSILEVTDEERQVGKAAELGCGYQMGAKKFVTSAWDVYRAKVDLPLAKIAVSTYRDTHSEVVELWKNYENACIFATENPGKRYRVGRVVFQMKGRFLQIILPSGRPLSYCDPLIKNDQTLRFEKGMGDDYDAIYVVEKYEGEILGSEIGRRLKLNGYRCGLAFHSKKFTYMAVNQKARKEECPIPKWVRERSYGGKITENIVQAVSRDILAEAFVRVEKAGYAPLMHSHDELVSEAPVGSRASSEGYRALMEELPEWADGLPLKASGWMGPRYAKK